MAALPALQGNGGPGPGRLAHEYLSDGDYIVNGVRFMDFRILSADEIQRHSVVRVTNSMLYDGGTSNPSRQGLLDRRLGLSSRNAKCDTCFKDCNTCVGHFGCLELVVPVYHVGYFTYTLEVLQQICKRCSRVLLTHAQRARYLPLLTEDLSPQRKKLLHKELIALCKKNVRACPFCDAPNGTVKKFAFLKIFHLQQAVDSVLVGKIFEQHKAAVEEVEAYFGAACEFLAPHNVLKLFERIPKADYPFLLLFDNTPMDLICTHIPVPPSIIRPSSHNSNGVRSTEDELTMKLNEILIANEALKKKLSDGVIFIQALDAWDFMQILVAVYINSDVRNLPPQHSNVASGLGIAQRLKGKEGRFRNNLSGKRVNFSARTVISPDPNLGINEVGIPLKIAQVMTFPVAVTPLNLLQLQELVKNGPAQHPGAVMIRKANGRSTLLKYGDRKQAARDLALGDVVDRHMLNGDYVLFNRQPSLHRLSIMCHSVRVHPDLTFKFNECVCNPYNADFDGDEMNVHFMQGEEAKAEAAMLMQSAANMTSPRNGEPVIAPIQDFITSVYLMTRPDVFFSKVELCAVIANLLSHKDYRREIVVPRPAILKPFPVWTGKQLFGMILRPFKDSKIRLNLVAPSKAYSGGKGRYSGEMCREDGYIHIRNSELLSGTLDKSVIGGGSKKNLFYLILKEYNSEEAIQAMLRLCRVSSFYITNRGFSIGLDDVTPTGPLEETKAQLVRSGYDKVAQFIEQFKGRTLQPITGLSAEQTLESLILKELSDIRDHAGKACIQELKTSNGKRNAPMIMAKSGSKGSYINVSQMAVCVGQQSIRGQRVAEGFHRRVLPHFSPGEKGAKAKGFVENSFWSGLDPFEFFFHAMAGREGLLDTAVKTAETGYMQRRLIKGLEDLVVHYDYSVRNSSGEVVQFEYGSDGIDPINVEAEELYIDFEYAWNHVLMMKWEEEKVVEVRTEERKAFLNGQELKEELRRRLDVICAELDFEKISSSSSRTTFATHYREKIEAFFAPVAARLDALFGRYNKAADDCDWQKISRITPAHLEVFLRRVARKFTHSKIDPGTAIGAICAQSIGEPTTQMTLKTFHFTGVASMNITQGVPRITEIINATKNSSTPFIVAHLLDSGSEAAAEATKLKIEKVYLDQICRKIYQCTDNGELCYVLALNDELFTKQLHLNENALVEEINAQLKPTSVKAVYPYIKICPRVKRMVYLPAIFEDEISSVVISGNRSVERVTIREDSKDGYYLAIEGNGLRDVLATRGIDARRTTSNNIHEVAAVLGIEAARATIISEIKSTMAGHGITIDARHLMLLADSMTASGSVVGMTRAGFSKVKGSTIKMASFERTIDNLYQASYYNNKDDLMGASECIIVGAPTRMGTGFFEVVPKLTTTKNIDYRRACKPRGITGLGAGLGALGSSGAGSAAAGGLGTVIEGLEL